MKINEKRKKWNSSSLLNCLAVFISAQDELWGWDLKIGHIIGHHTTFLWIRPIAIWLMGVFAYTAKLGVRAVTQASGHRYWVRFSVWLAPFFGRRLCAGKSMVVVVWLWISLSSKEHGPKNTQGGNVIVMLYSLSSDISALISFVVCMTIYILSFSSLSLARERDSSFEASHTEIIFWDLSWEASELFIGRHFIPGPFGGDPRINGKLKLYYYFWISNSSNTLIGYIQFKVFIKHIFPMLNNTFL